MGFLVTEEKAKEHQRRIELELLFGRSNFKPFSKEQQVGPKKSKGVKKSWPKKK